MSGITSSTNTTLTSPIAAHSAITHISQIKSIQSFYDAAIHGYDLWI